MAVVEVTGSVAELQVAGSGGTVLKTLRREANESSDAFMARALAWGASYGAPPSIASRTNLNQYLVQLERDRTTANGYTAREVADARTLAAAIRRYAPPPSQQQAVNLSLGRAADASPEGPRTLVVGHGVGVSAPPRSSRSRGPLVAAGFGLASMLIGLAVRRKK